MGLLVALLGFQVACQKEATTPGDSEKPAAPATQAARPAPAPVAPKPATTASRPDPAQGNPGYNQRDIPPDFELPFLANGKGKQRLSTLVGPTATAGLDGVVVAFVASWCGRCKDSYPTLMELQAKHKGRLQILLLTAEEDEAGKEKMAMIASEQKLTLPLLDAPPDLIEQWLGTQRNIPRFYLLDYKGMVRVKDTGFGQKMAKLLPNQVDWLLSIRSREEGNATQL